MIEKDPADVLSNVAEIESYIAEYLMSNNLSFDEWIARFGRGMYLERNLAILEFARQAQPKAIFEFACAGPFLAKVLLNNLAGITRYACTNFSPQVVDYCKKYINEDDRYSAALIDADITRSADMRRQNMSTYDAFITTSLEHIQFDRELVKELPEGASFIFCVALFDDPEHFRVFTDIGDIKSRYGDLLTIIDFWLDRNSSKLVVYGLRR